MRRVAYFYGVLFLLVTISIEVTGQHKRLGKHSPPSKGATVLAGKFPPPPVFYHHFIKLGQPLLMKNVLSETKYPAFEKWTDSYLRTQYGDEIVDIERGKKEDREGKAVQLHLSEFLDIYEKGDFYMVHSVSDSMKDEVMVPHSLQCGGFQNNLQDAVVWFSAGETMSVLHYDSVDNINCLLDGEKKLVLIDRKYKRMVEEHGWVEDGAYSLVDVDAVDPISFPGVHHAAWHQISMEKGDCVYIPYKWYHHVYSPPGRNLAINLWFSHLFWFNTTDCKDFTSKESQPLSKFPMASPNEQLRSEFVSRFEGNGDMSLKTFKLDCGCENEQDAEKIWELMNKNKDRKLTVEELYSFEVDEVVRQVPGCFHIDESDDDDAFNDEITEDHADKREDTSESEEETESENGSDNEENKDDYREIGETLEKEVLTVTVDYNAIDRSAEDKDELEDRNDIDKESDKELDEIQDEDLSDKTGESGKENIETKEKGESVISSTDDKIEVESEVKRKIESTSREKHSHHDEF